MLNNVFSYHIDYGYQNQYPLLFNTDFIMIQQELIFRTQDEDSNIINQPTTIFKLIQKVGSRGRYQYTLLMVFFIIWAVNAMSSMYSALIFIPKPFSCPNSGLLQQNCHDSVCSLPQKSRSSFQDYSGQYSKNIATQIARDAVCDKQFYLDLASSMFFLGSFIGFILFSTFADSYGRRRIMIISWVNTVIGSIVLISSQNLIMSGTGLLLIGFGTGTTLNMTFAYLAEVYQNQDRQKYTVVLQSMFPVGGIIILLQVQFIPHWIIITMISLVLPSLIVMFFILTYIEETPIFLLVQGIPKTLKALNRIGKINRGISNILSEKDIKEVMQAENKTNSGENVEKTKNSSYSTIDLFRYSSLRWTVIPFSVNYFGICAMYYGLNFMLDQFGIDTFTAGYILYISQLFVYYPAYRLIKTIPRRKCSLILFSVAGICTTIQSFIGSPNCSFCLTLIVKVLVLTVFKVTVAFQFTIMNVYLVELYPNKVQASATGFTVSMGALATVLCPIGIGFFKRNEIDPNLIFTMLAFFSFSMSLFLKQTVGRQMEDEIQEIKQAKQSIKRQLEQKKSYKQMLSKSESFYKKQPNELIQTVRSQYS